MYSSWRRHAATNATGIEKPVVGTYPEDSDEASETTESQPHNFPSLEDLESEESSELFDLIDKFRELNLNEDISLPQLVVVGDQSSGKSSLLEGLTEISFPVASDLCTRFATQIVLRRVDSLDTNVRATIIPGSEAANNEVLKELRRFDKSIPQAEFTSESFAEILNEASEVMGLPRPGAGTEGTLTPPEKRFSNNILKIELSGPQHPNLTVVDVPGLFHNATIHQTDDDRELIRQLINDYISDSRTIIMAVMDGKNNLANQEVFRMARNVDPEGKRTVGIITKCDQVQQGDERGVIQIARNSVEKLHHGWFVVKNRSTKDIQNGVTIAERHVKEREFFSRPPWNSLPRERIGIDKLKPFLAHLLLEHVRAEFPRLLAEINSLVVDTERSLQELGETRATPMEQRMYLTRIANDYGRRVTDYLDGRLRDAADMQSPLKIRTLIQNLNDEFGARMKAAGHTRRFKEVDGREEGDDAQSSRHAPAKQDDIYTWIWQIYRNSRGPELPGLVNPNILIEVFREQSANWSNISRDYVSEAMAIVTRFNSEILKRVVVDENVRRKLAANLSRATTDAVNKAYQELSQLLEAEHSGILLTVNDEFARKLDEVRQQRVLGRLRAVQVQPNGAGAQAINALDNLMRAVVLSNEESAVYDIHDVLKCYYHISLKRFTDNVIIQVIEGNLLGRSGPIRLLNTDYISGLEQGELTNIAKEDWQVASTRRELMSRLERAKSAQEAASILSI
ncbi:hypothetical protein TWF696_003271 [Orbilia brochopaga]